MKNKTMKTFLAKIGAVALSTVLVVNLTACGKEDTTLADTDEHQESLLEKVISQQVSNYHSSTSGKEETVFVMANANGSTNKVIVSDWLKNPEEDKELRDVTTLSDIENVKGNETYTTGSDGEIIWNTQGNDIYYHGTTKKELPVDMKITYTLNGKEITPQELAGKSGRVTIRFDYTNKEKKNVSIGGKETEIYVPFAMISGMILPEDTFSNIEVTNGKLLSEGSNSIVMGVAFPGLRESLDVDALKKEIQDEENIEDMNIPDYMEISADVTDFSLGMTMTMAMSNVLGDVHLTDSLDFDSLKNSMNELQSAGEQLVTGTSDLKDGTSELKDAADKAATGSDTLKAGTDTLKAGTAELYTKSGELDAGADKLKSGAKELVFGGGQLSAGIDSLASGAGELDAGAAQLQSGLTAVKSGVEALDAACNTGSTKEDGTAVPALRTAAGSVATGANGLNELLKNYFQNYESAIMTMIDNAQKALAAAQTSKAQTQALLDAAIVERDHAQAALQSATQVTTTQIEVPAQTSQNESVSGNDGAPTTTTVEVTNLSQEGVTSAVNAYQAAQAQVTSLEQEVATYAAKEASAAETIAQLGALYASTGAFGADENTAASAGKGAYISYILQTSQALADGAGALNTGVGTISDSLAVLDGKVPQKSGGVPALSAGMATLKNGTSQAVAGTKALKDGATKLNSGLGTLETGTKDLKEGTTKLVAGVNTLNNGAASLQTGAGDLSSGLSLLSAGVVTLDNGALTLKDGMVQFDTEGISKLTSMFGDNMETVTDRINAVMEAGKEYNTFTEVPQGTEGSVKFIIKTDAIK